MIRTNRRHLARRALLLLTLAVSAAGLLPIPAAAAAPAAAPAAAHPFPAVQSTLRKALPAGRTASPYTAPSGPHGYIPCDITAAYYRTGVTQTGTGARIAILDVHDQPNIASDLQQFDAVLGIADPPGGLLKFKQNQDFSTLPGGSTGTVTADYGWGSEITLDVEWAHAMAPGATVGLFEAVTGSPYDLLSALDYAVHTWNADVVSMSFGFTEDSSVTGFFHSHFVPTNSAGHPVVYLASTGDSGHAVSWPAVDPSVVAVGGTSLAASATGDAAATTDHSTCTPSGTPGTTSSNETAWGRMVVDDKGNVTWSASGGGQSAYTSQPAYQAGITHLANRSVPDLAALANPQTGVATYNTFENPATDPACGCVVPNGWSIFLTGGTSLAAPLVAGMVATVDQARTTTVGPGGDLGGVAWVYGLSAAALTDIVTGSNGSCGTECTAGPGYDAVTGRGSPHVSALITPPAPGQYHPLRPYRAADTRPGSGFPLAGQTFGGGTVQSLTLTGGSVPAGATAVVLNVTATNTTAAGYLTLWPADQPRPTASSLNWTAGITIPNLVTVPLSPGGAIAIFNPAGTVDVIVDVAGFYSAPSGTDGLYNGLSPYRLADTRPGSGYALAGATFGTDTQRDLAITGLPAGASAVVLNVTVTNTSADGYLTVWPAGTTRPTASNLNWAAGTTIPNRVIVKLGAANTISIYNPQGAADVIVDVNGWFTDGATATTGAQFFALPPTRIIDTRLSSGGAGPLAGGEARPVLVAGRLGVDPAASAVVMNATAVTPTSAGFISFYPTGTSRPTVSDLNFVGGQVIPNMSIVKLGGGGLTAYAAVTGGSDLVLDVTGYYK